MDIMPGTRERWRPTLMQGFALLFAVCLFQIWLELQIDRGAMRLLFITLTSVGVGAMAAKVSYQGGRVAHRTALWRAMMFLVVMLPVRIALYSYLGETP